MEVENFRMRIEKSHFHHTYALLRIVRIPHFIFLRVIWITMREKLPFCVSQFLRSFLLRNLCTVLYHLVPLFKLLLNGSHR